MGIYWLLAAIATTPNTELPTVNTPPLITVVPVPNTAPPKGVESNAIAKGYPGTWAGSLDYPSLALREEREGTTAFKLTVNKEGRVSDCTIISSSGHADLDEVTCNRVTARAEFYPAQDKTGQPTVGHYSNRVRWQIPNYAPMTSFPRGPIARDNAWTRILPKDFPSQALAEKRQGRVMVELSVSAVGTVEDCQILKSSAYADLDAATCKIASSQANFGPALDVMGQPTAGRIQTRIDWRIPGEGGISFDQTQRPPVVMPKGLLPKAGTTDVAFTVAADGSLTDCHRQSSVVETNFAAADAICKMKIKFEPYTDAQGKPVARRVTIKTTIELEDIQ